MAGSDVSRIDLLKTRDWLDRITVFWYAIAAITAITAGILADSIALTGFGLNSIIETAVMGMMLRRSYLKVLGRERHQTAEQKFLFVFGVIFFLLSLYLLHESGSKLFYVEKPHISIFGLVFAALAVAVTAVLTLLKLRLSKYLDIAMLQAAGKENAVTCCLSLMLFLGLWFEVKEGLWWADPAAAMAMIPFMILQGSKAIEASKSSSLGKQSSKLI
jgi:divalent metal cation (Fe/Co/Zn/Cd) transporter